MTHLTPKDVLDRYSVLDYSIRYLCEDVRPSERPEPHTVFALECSPGELVLNAMGEPWVFDSEAQAFAYRNRLGILHPVLAFYEAGYAPDAEEYDPAVHGALAERDRIEAYADGRED